MAKKIDVTIKIALFRLSSLAASSTSILSMVKEQRAWGSHPHLSRESAKKESEKTGNPLEVIFEDPPYGGRFRLQ